MISADASAVRYGKNSIAIGQSGDGRVVTTTNPVTDGAGNSTSQALTITIDGSAQLLSAGFPYAFQFKGYDSNGPVLMLGSYIPQSDGSSFKGMIEIHSVTNNGRSSANFTGNYTVGADGRGTLTAPSLSGSPVFAFAFDSVGNTASVIEFDISGQRGTGFMIRDEVARSFPLNTVINGYWLPTIRAAIELSRSNPAAALQILRSAIPHELGYPNPQVGVGRFLYPPYLRGQAYLALHRRNEAAQESQKIIDHRSLLENCPLSALAHLGSARAYGLAFETNKQSQCLRRFLRAVEEC